MSLKHVYKKKHKKEEMISDHAIVQFLQRTGVLDIKDLRRELTTLGLRKAAQMCSDNDSVVQHNENGLQFVLQRGRVKTILTYDSIRLPNGDIAKVEEGTRFINQ